MTTQEKLADALKRQSYFSFLRCVIHELFPNEEYTATPFLEAMCFAVQQVTEGNTSHLLITLPPRHLKSTNVSVALPAFALGHAPDSEIMVASYNQEFSRLHADQFRKVIESDWYKRLFAHVRIARGQNRYEEIRTTEGGSRKVVTLGGTATGRGADLLIIDDLMKAGDASSDVRRNEARTFYEETLVSRINNKANMRIIAVQQRLREDDFAGFLIEEKNFTHFNLPAIAQRDEELPLYYGRTFTRHMGDALNPDREPLDVLDRIRRELGDRAFAAQYLQDPVPSSNALIRFEEIATCDHPPDRALCAPVVQSWDPAFTDEPRSAYSVCTTWGQHDCKWYLLDVYRQRHDFARLHDVVLRQHKAWNADRVVIEKDGSGGALVNQLRSNGHIFVGSWPTRGHSKDDRLIEQSHRLTSGSFVIPTQPNWFDELRREFRSIPNGRYRDQVDSITQFVDWMYSSRGRVFLHTDPVTGRRDDTLRRREGRRR